MLEILFDPETIGLRMKSTKERTREARGREDEKKNKKSKE